MSDRHILPPYSLRMPAELRDQLEEAAKTGKRSLNAEIVARLESTFSLPTIDGREKFILKGKSEDWELSHISALLRAAALHFERRADVMTQLAEIKVEIENLEQKKDEQAKAGTSPAPIEKQLAALLEHQLKLQDEFRRIEETLPGREVLDAYGKR